MEILIPVVIVAVIAAVCGVALSVLSHVFSVPVDEKQEKVREALPGANCGACGYSGCDGYAEAIAKGEASPDKCAPGGKSTAEALSEILGVEIDVKEIAAFVGCRGENGVCNKRFDYVGIRTCAAAVGMFGGEGACPSSCIGFGDCVSVCSASAVKICNGVAVINPSLCGGCGVCADTCPKKLISMAEKKLSAKVLCSNTQKGGVARKNCTAACIGCKKCEKVCEQNAVKVENNLAVIDSALCNGCGTCAEQCPQKCIAVY